MIMELNDLSVRENIKYLTERIIKKAISVNRNPDDIKLIAVSKNFGIKEIKEAFDAGLRNFGENKALELRDKAEYWQSNNMSANGEKRHPDKPAIYQDRDSVQPNSDLSWHFIGHLQTNKVKYIADKVKYIHSVDSLNLAQTIEKYAVKFNLSINVLLEVKTSDEATKYGLVSEEDIFQVAEFCKSSEKLNLKGLMTIAPFTDNTKDIRHSFISLRNLKEKLTSAGFPMPELSMGMTSDFEIAIEEGATFLRVGTAIFGERFYPNSTDETTRFIGD